MPTGQEIQELVKYCGFEGGYLNDVAGNFVIGPNGNSIFIPFAGLRHDTDLMDGDYVGFYWAAPQYVDDAFSLYCGWDHGSWDRFWFLCECEYGLSVRPVSD